MTDEAEMQETTAVDETDQSVDDEDFFNEGFDDDSSEETTEETEESDEATEETEEDDTEEDTTDADTLDFKFYGKVSKLPKGSVEKVAKALDVSAEEAVVLLQKGMDYDHAVMNTDLHKLIHQFAVGVGMTDQDYIQTLRNKLPTFAENVARDRIANEHPDWDDEKIEMAVRLDVQDKARRAETEQNKMSRKIEEDVEAFHAKYPDVEKFPDEVLADIRRNISPIEAYESYIHNKEYEAKMAELDAKIKQAEQKLENKKHAVGSMKDSAGAKEHDAFLEALFAD